MLIMRADLTYNTIYETAWNMDHGTFENELASLEHLSKLGEKV